MPCRRSEKFSHTPQNITCSSSDDTQRDAKRSSAISLLSIMPMRLQHSGKSGFGLAMGALSFGTSGTSKLRASAPVLHRTRVVHESENPPNHPTKRCSQPLAAVLKG